MILSTLSYLCVVGEDEGGNIISGYRPERIIALVVESLQKLVMLEGRQKGVVQGEARGEGLESESQYYEWAKGRPAETPEAGV